MNKRAAAREWLWYVACVVATIAAGFLWMPDHWGWMDRIGIAILLGVALYTVIGVIRPTVWAVQQ